MDPITILAGIKTGLAAGKTVAGLSKQIGQFFDATDQAKKTLQKKGVSSKSSNATALDRWAKLRQAAEAEEELKEWITQTYGRSKYLELLKIRREVLAEKREAEAQARRDAIQTTRTYDYYSGYNGSSYYDVYRSHRLSSLHGLVRCEGLLSMIYVLVFLHFISTDRLQYYQIGTFSDKEQCLEQAEKAQILVTHNSMKVTCLEVNSQQ